MPAVAHEAVAIDYTTAMIDITHACNDTCLFCYDHADLNKSPAMSLLEVQRRFARAAKRWPISQVILTGGEPTLHPDFFAIFQHFLEQKKLIVSLNTNALRFIDQAFCKRIAAVLRDASCRKRMFSLSLSSVDRYPAQTALERTKLAGLRAAIRIAKQAGIHIVTVLAVTKTNYRVLPQLVSYVAKQLPPGSVISIRGLYLGDFMDAAQKAATVPPDWQLIQPFVIEAIRRVLRRPQLKLRLFNLPLCYFRELPELPKIIDQAQPFFHERRIQMMAGKRNKVVRYLGETWQVTACADCALSPVCAKIQHEFISSYQYPVLTLF